MPYIILMLVLKMDLEDYLTEKIGKLSVVSRL